MSPDPACQGGLSPLCLTSAYRPARNGFKRALPPEGMSAMSLWDFMAISKALGDENRVRMLLALRKQELCLCQIIELVGLAPSCQNTCRSFGKRGLWKAARTAAGSIIASPGPTPRPSFARRSSGCGSRWPMIRKWSTTPTACSKFSGSIRRSCARRSAFPRARAAHPASEPHDDCSPQTA